MKTIFATLTVSLIFSLVLTPFISSLAYKFNVVDAPNKRKVHLSPVPRLGGIAIFFSVFLALIPIFILKNNIFLLFSEEAKLLPLAFGGVMTFCLGLTDDLFGLRARFKFIAQIAIGVSLYFGGINIQVVTVPLIDSAYLGWLSLPITVFWVLLVMNAINLIDGLDGLAAGISLFVAIVLMILCLFSGKILIAVILASLCGAILGFLPYNFNPASIFMGDSGSYFLGYMIAAISMMGSIKGQTATTLLIPMIALGIPLMDTFWATIRRYAIGRKIFSPDDNHFHHRLIKKGFSHRRTVLILYGVTVCMGLASLCLVFMHDAQIAVFMCLILVLCFVGIHQLGYMDNLNVKGLGKWGRSISEELGFNRGRRIHNGFHIAISHADDIDTFWERSIKAFEAMGFDYVRMALWEDGVDPQCVFDNSWHENDATRDASVLYQYNRLYMRYPLEKYGKYMGSLMMSREEFDSSSDLQYVLPRVERLRRCMIEKIYSFNELGLLSVDQNTVYEIEKPEDSDEKIIYAGINSDLPN